MQWCFRLQPKCKRQTMYLDSHKYLKLINKRNAANAPKFLQVVKSFPTQMTFIHTIGNSDREIVIEVLERDLDVGHSCHLSTGARGRRAVS